MKVGLFGGTFDPVHHGHLILARDCVELLELDRLVFIPNTLSPHKEARLSAPGSLRLEMLRAAIQGEQRFEVDDLELRRGGPSYAIETVEEYHRRNPGAELYYLVGEDNLPLLNTWRRYEDLMRRVKFVTLSRRDRGDNPADHPFPVVRRNIEISATEIRMRIAKGESVRYLVPDEVLEVIGRENLYKEMTY
jgi:nicotinate-nucleotide adenylyltransferase